MELNEGNLISDSQEHKQDTLLSTVLTLEEETIGL